MCLHWMSGSKKHGTYNQLTKSFFVSRCGCVFCHQRKHFSSSAAMPPTPLSLLLLQYKITFSVCCPCRPDLWHIQHLLFPFYSNFLNPTLSLSFSFIISLARSLVCLLVRSLIYEHWTDAHFHAFVQPYYPFNFRRRRHLHFFSFSIFSEQIYKYDT